MRTQIMDVLNLKNNMEGAQPLNVDGCPKVLIISFYDVVGNPPEWCGVVERI